jgi:predicted DNA-binding protein (MmcQ/YjbR family)
MNREELEAYIRNHYATLPDYPWADTPRAAVFRHANNRKWFALMMEVPRDKLGLAGAEKLDIVNFKCDPILIASLRGEPGIFPAYHMNKSSWITAALDGSVSTETIELLLDVSYELTMPKTRRKAAKGKENE